MKKLVLVLAFAAYVLLLPSRVNAQFDMEAVGFQKWARTDPGPPNSLNPQAVGIGNFASPNAPSAALHVNTALLPVPISGPALFAPGETFRTQTALGIGTQNWSMYRGNTETFRIGTVASGLNDNVTINASNGRMDLSTANTDSVRIMGGNATTGGYVGIGNVGGGFTPASTVHIHGVAGLVDPVLRLTSPATGPTAGDGFGIGIAFNQQEARPVLFSTQRQNRLT